MSESKHRAGRPSLLPHPHPSRTENLTIISRRCNLESAKMLHGAITVHGIAMIADPDERMRAIQLSFFLKGVAMTGAALLITQLGVKRTEQG
jgi:hypothetical protein